MCGLLLNITLIHYIGNIILIRSTEQEVANTLNSLVTHMHIRRWEIQPKISVKFLGSHWCGLCRTIPSMVKENLLHLAPPITIFSGPIGFWRQHIPLLDVLLYPIYQVTQKVASFICGLEGY